MVDFQSRDARPTFGDDDGGDPGDAGEDEAGDDAPAATPADTGGEEPAADSSEPEGASRPLGVAVVTVVAGGEVEEDAVGSEAVATVEAADAVVPSREVVAPGYDGVQQALGGLMARKDVDAIVTLGGAGVAPEQTAVDAARALFDTDLPGFGEGYRARVRERSEATGIRVRTTAGIADGVAVFCLPLAPEAVDLGVAELVLPELPAIVAALRE